MTVQINGNEFNIICKISAVNSNVYVIVKLNWSAFYMVEHVAAIFYNDI